MLFSEYLSKLKSAGDYSEEQNLQIKEIKPDGIYVITLGTEDWIPTQVEKKEYFF